MGTLIDVIYGQYGTIPTLMLIWVRRQIDHDETKLCNVFIIIIIYYNIIYRLLIILIFIEYYSIKRNLDELSTCFVFGFTCAYNQRIQVKQVAGRSIYFFNRD